MALAASLTWEVRTTGAAANGGAFDVGSTGFAADLAATSATGAAPVVSSASYTFVSTDVGALVFLKSGTGWIPGWYAIASVNAGAATLSAAIGAAALYGGASLLNKTAGCASTASPTSGTYSIDYSQQASAQYAYTDLVVGSTTTQVTSAAKPFSKACVGNVVKITGGTGFTVGWFEVVSVAGVTATLDRSAGTASSTGGTANLGGALDGLATLSSAMVASNKAFVKGGPTYVITAGVTFSGGPNPPNATNPPNVVSGYASYRGDGGRPTIQLSTNTGLTAISITGTGWILDSIIVDCNALGASTGVATSGLYAVLRNLKVINFTAKGVSVANSRSEVYNCEVTAGASGAAAAISLASTGVVCHACHVHDNGCVGIVVGAQAMVADCLVANNTGATSDGIQTASECTILSCTVYGSGRSGLNVTAANGYEGMYYRNNIFASNGGYGLVGMSAAGYPSDSRYDGNAYYGNTSGARSNADDRGTVNAVNGVAPYANVNDVILTANPFISSSTNDYRLNTSAGGGAACRGHGVPTTWPGNSKTTSAVDMGAAQHADPATYRGRRGT